MLLIHHQINQKDGFLTYPPPPPPPSPPSSGGRISPAVLFIIVILAVLFFISGLVHLLVRFIIKRPSFSSSSQSNRYPEISSTDALQRQLQQLFSLHDSGLDQAFIDALPVFQYKEIMGLKEPFDCAVCLCEFAQKDKLRLLPICSHAFHINCIDTWLLSNSTCPLCRTPLFKPGFPMENPIFDYDDMIEEDRCIGNGDNGLSCGQKTVKIEGNVGMKRGLSVRLGKFRKFGNEAGEIIEEETSSSSLDARRCYSMGSYQYVLDDLVLRVSLSHDGDTHHVRIEQNESCSVNGDVEGKRINSVSKGDSYSVSKIWLWPRKGKSDIRIGMPSINSELPWLEEGTQGRQET